MNGIIPLFKERGMTSHDCVSQLRKILKTKKVGHSGTLDPNVDGVLPIAVGSATKIVEYLMASGKTYTGELLIGQATTTEDLDGDVIEQQPVAEEISRAKLIIEMGHLTGTITQIPPMYSAVKVNGRKLYEYARAGETVERPQRQITVTRFELISSHYDAATQTQRVRFEVDCSKGTYIRTLVADLARHLGYPGVMSDLTRTKSGGFELNEAHSLTEIAKAVEEGQLNQVLFPIDRVLSDFPRHELAATEWAMVKNGVWLPYQEITETNADVISIVYQNEIKALYSRHDEDQSYKPLKMISVN